MRIALLTLLFITLLFACKNKASKEQKPDLTAPDSIVQADPRVKDSTLRSLTQAILTSFKNKNYDTLINFIHPDAGVRFSPYAYIDTLHDRRLTATELINEAKAKKKVKMNWGQFDGSGEPINMAIDEYVKNFVYDADFIKPEVQKVDTIVRTGNSLSNIGEVYEKSHFTESHFSGFDKKFEGMDWRSLRLVFQLKDGKYYLVGVVHDQWTT